MLLFFFTSNLVSIFGCRPALVLHLALPVAIRIQTVLPATAAISTVHLIGSFPPHLRYSYGLHNSNLRLNLGRLPGSHAQRISISTDLPFPLHLRFGATPLSVMRL